MRDGVRAGLGQRVGVGVWLAIGAALALLAWQTTLVSGEVIVTELGAGAAATDATNDLAAAPALPSLSPGAQTIVDGSDAPVDEAPAGDAGARDTPTVVGGGTDEIAVIPANGVLSCITSGLTIGTEAGIATADSGGTELTDIDPCDPAVVNLIATCTFQGATLAFGAGGIDFDTPPAVGDVVDSTVAEILADPNAVINELYMCGDRSVTVQRSISED